MKPNKRQLELIKFCKEILYTWENTNDISSPTHYNDLMDFINADLDNYSNKIQDEVWDALTDLLNIIRKLKYEDN